VIEVGDDGGDDGGNDSEERNNQDVRNDG